MIKKITYFFIFLLLHSILFILNTFYYAKTNNILNYFGAVLMMYKILSRIIAVLEEKTNKNNYSE